MLEVVIFSKDRACQLEFLLRSIKHHFHGWADTTISVLYTYGGPSHKASYQAVMQLHPEFRYMCERDLACGFKAATLRLFGAREYVMFAVDDDVFKNPFALNTPEFQAFAKNEAIACLSLRMCPRMDYSYMESRPVATPTFSDGTIWDWTTGDGDWGYPMSLDGHIFRNAEMRPLVESLEFARPNELEDELSRHPLSASKAICFKESKIINLPLNRVQDVAPNRHGSVEAESLNAQFLRRRRLSLETVAGVVNPSPHHELVPSWEEWGDVAVTRQLFAPMLARVAASRAIITGRRVGRRLLRMRG